MTDILLVRGRGRACFERRITTSLCSLTFRRLPLEIPTITITNSIASGTHSETLVRTTKTEDPKFAEDDGFVLEIWVRPDSQHSLHTRAAPYIVKTLGMLLGISHWNIVSDANSAVKCRFLYSGRTSSCNSFTRNWSESKSLVPGQFNPLTATDLFQAREGRKLSRNSRPSEFSTTCLERLAIA